MRCPNHRIRSSICQRSSSCGQSGCSYAYGKATSHRSRAGRDKGISPVDATKSILADCLDGDIACETNDSSYNGADSRYDYMCDFAIGIKCKKWRSSHVGVIV